MIRESGLLSKVVRLEIGTEALGLACLLLEPITGSRGSCFVSSVLAGFFPGKVVDAVFLSVESALIEFADTCWDKFFVGCFCVFGS